MRVGRRPERGQQPRAQNLWPYRMLRGLWPDRNPLRRTVDRVETCLLAGLLVAAVAAAPFAAQAASHAVYGAALRTQQEQLASRHQAVAVLTKAAGNGVSGYGLTASVPAAATWTTQSGVTRSGDVLAPANAAKGTKVSVWINAAGDLTSPPLAENQVAGQGQAAAIGTVTALVVCYFVLVMVIRRAFDRRRLAAWEADWRVTAKAWNHRQRG